jgi:hypothetical protein
MPGDLTIGKLAEQAGVNVETIRYYQRRGLLAEPKKAAWRIPSLSFSNGETSALY